MADSELESSSSTASSRKVSANGPFKVILIGVSGVGKSSLFLRIKDGEFHEDIRNQNLDYLDKSIAVNNNKSVKSVQLRLYDTAGMESWHEKTITRSYYLGSRIVLIVYSADDMDSVDDLGVYIAEVNRHAPSAKKFLIRNKIDLEEQAVEEEEVEAKLKKAGYSFESKCKHQTSAKTGKGIENLIKEIGTALVKQAQSVSREEVNALKLYRQESRNSNRQSSCC